MSQIYKSLASGPVPPTVPTQFTEDTGVATPAGNNLNVFGDDTTSNDVDGITTTGAGSTVTILLTNRVSISTTTSDGAGQTQTVNLFTPSAGTSIAFRFLVTGYDTANNETAGGELIGLARSAGGTLVVIGTNDTFDESDVALAATDWDIIDTGSPILQATFTGVAGRTIAWRGLFEYTQAP